MPLYEFRREDGKIVERFYPIAMAPDAGERVMFDGAMHVRIISIPQIDAGTAQKVRGFPYRSRQYLNDDGSPIIVNSLEHERQVAKERGLSVDRAFAKNTSRRRKNG